MENSWQFATPKYLRVGRNSSLDLPKYLQGLSVKKLFLVADPGLVQSNKLVQELIKNLDVEKEVFTYFSTNPTTEQVNNAVQVYLKFKPDSIVAIGGGSAIDLAKATILTALNGGIIEDYLAGKKGSIAFPPFIILPTTCGTGSEASPYAVITDREIKKKRGIEDRNFLPTLVIMDPQLVMSLDQAMIAATAIDALAHVVESFISKKANEITRSSARGLFINLIENIEGATFDKDESALSNMLNIAFASRLLYPRTGLTIAHALSHPLGAHTGIHHGLAVSFFLPVAFDFNYLSCKKELDEAFRLMGFSSKDKFDDWFVSFCNKSGVKRSINEHLKVLDLPKEVMAKDAMESSNIPSNPRLVSEKDLVSVIERAVIYWK